MRELVLLAVLSGVDALTMGATAIAPCRAAGVLGSHGMRTLPVRHRLPAPTACASEGLIDRMCAFETGEGRQTAMKSVFGSWTAGSHDEKGDDVVAQLSTRIGDVQTAALAAHGRGEDTAGQRVESARLAAPWFATPA